MVFRKHPLPFFSPIFWTFNHLSWIANHNVIDSLYQNFTHLVPSTQPKTSSFISMYRFDWKVILYKNMIHGCKNIHCCILTEIWKIEVIPRFDDMNVMWRLGLMLLLYANNSNLSFFLSFFPNLSLPFFTRPYSFYCNSLGIIHWTWNGLYSSVPRLFLVGATLTKLYFIEQTEKRSVTTDHWQHLKDPTIKLEYIENNNVL